MAIKVLADTFELATDGNEIENSTWLNPRLITQHRAY